MVVAQTSGQQVTGAVAQVQWESCPLTGRLPSSRPGGCCQLPGLQAQCSVRGALSLFRVENKAQEDQRRHRAGVENLPGPAASAALARPAAQVGPNENLPGLQPPLPSPAQLYKSGLTLRNTRAPVPLVPQRHEVLPWLEDAGQAGVSTPESVERPSHSLTHSRPSGECLGKHLCGVFGILHRLFSCLSAFHTGCFWNKIPKLQHRQLRKEGGHPFGHYRLPSCAVKSQPR